MNTISASEYLLSFPQEEAISEPLLSLEFVLNKNNEKTYFETDKSLVIKMFCTETKKTYSVKLLLSWNERQVDRLKLISQNLNDNHIVYFDSFQIHENAISVVQNGELIECPVLISEWVEGVTLREYLLRLCQKHAIKKLQSLAYNFSRMASWLHELPFAHGDISFDNIIIDCNDMLHLIDLNGVYIPAIEGEKAIETWSPGFNHPARTEHDFSKFIDDFNFLFILLTIEVLVLYPESYYECESLQNTKWELKYANFKKIADLPLIKVIINHNNRIANLYKLYKNEYSSDQCRSIPEFYLLIEKWISNPFSESEKKKILVPFIPKNIDKVGYIGSDGMQKIFPIFDEAHLFSEGLALIKIGGKRIKLSFSNQYGTFKSKCGYIDKGGNAFIPWIFDSAKSFREGLAAVIYKKKSGYINTKGYIEIPFNFEYCDDFINGFARVAIGVDYYVEYGDEEYLNLENAIWGVIDKKGKTIIPLKYSAIERDSIFFKVCGTEEYIFPNKKESGWGILDERGSKVIPCKYNEIATIFEGNDGDLYIVVTNHDKVGMVRIKKLMDRFISDEVIPCSYDSLKPLSKFIIEAKFGGKLIDPSRSEKEYREIEDFGSEDYMQPFLKYGNTVIVNYSGQLLGDFKIAKNKSYSLSDDNKLFIVTNSKSLTGVINEYGKIVIPCDFSSIEIVDDKCVIATKTIVKKGKYAMTHSKTIYVYNMTGKLIVFGFEKYDQFASKRLSIIILKLKGKWGSLNLDGKIGIPFIYDEIIQLKENYVKVQYNSKVGLLNTLENKLLIPCTNNNIKHLTSKIFAIQKSSKWGLYDLEQNKIISSYSYENIQPLDNAHVVIYKGGKCGILKIENMNIKTPIEFDDIKHLSENFCRIDNNGKWGLFDLNSYSILISPLYDEIKDFSHNLLSVRINNKWGVFDIGGKNIVEPTYDMVEIINTNRFSVYIIDQPAFDFDMREEKGHWEIIDSKNKIIDQFEGFLEFNDDQEVHEVYITTNPYSSSDFWIWKVDKYYNQNRPPIFVDNNPLGI